jgi:hypothetical protein
LQRAKVRNGFRNHGDTSFNLDPHVVAVANNEPLHIIDRVG